MHIFEGNALLEDVTAWPEQSGEFGKYTVRATATGVPTVKRRSQV